MAKEKINPVIKKKKPYEPPVLDEVIVNAVKAVFSGTANEGQQQTFIKHLIDDTCQYYGMSFAPGDQGRRDTDFAEGKRFVAAHLITVSKMPGGKL